ncbi:MAG: GTP 3',8-cyclase MoaA [Clostridiales bacterium]|nr:GTP 3',8-cyclase MoaA [Clostridiales bacterium]
MKDSFGREIKYARISITDLCNLRCKYCMPEEGIRKKACSEILNIEDYVIIAKALVDLGIEKIRITGGEPLVRKGLLSLVRQIGAIEGLKNLAITTNGILLPKYGEELYKAGIKNVNISLDSLDPEKYKDITRGGNLSDVLAGIENSIELGFEKVKINVVLIQDFNDDEIEKFVRLTEKKPIDVRFIELMPFKGQHELALGKYLPGDVVLEKVPDLQAIDDEDSSSPARYYKLEGALGRVGLINPLSHKFCDRCNRLRITADGFILSCLHSRKEIDLKGSLDDPDKLKELILKSINEKPLSHNLEKGELMDRDMINIGG